MTRKWLRRLGIAVTLSTLAAGSAGPAEAQPWGRFFGPNPINTHGYIAVPHSPALNPTGAFTFEAWVWEREFVAGEDCRTIAGKNYLQSWWVGFCTVGGKRILRSYLKGGSSARNGGEILPDQWVHIAVTFDGVKRRHYVDGELVAEFNETGPLSTSNSELRLFSDVSWQFTPRGYLREVRLWNVARTVSQLRSWINRDITAAQGGLVAVWPLVVGGENIVGAYDGSIEGTGTFVVYSASNSCTPSATRVCFNSRFGATVSWRTNGGATGVGSVVPGFSTDSANFWFFAPANWELLLKTVNGCGLNDRHWIFYAPVTDVHYKIIVYDAQEDVIRVFFGYQGLTDGDTNTDAFNTCP